LFADLSGFTTLSEKMDPEDVKALAHRCTGRLSEEVRRFGGTVLGIAGDQVVAAFGAPVAHEDDAERAVRAALAMRDCPLQDGNGKAIKVHAGVNTGEVMAGLIGPQEHQDYAVMGDTTNVAARLMSAAPAGSVLVGEETWRATRNVIKYRDLPPVLAKGKQQPVPVWEALEALAAPKSRPLGTAPLVGRDDELGLLSGIWLRVVREARPHLVTVLGDPGLGKSRLVAEFEKRFCSDALVLHGRCLPYGEALGYWALATALKEATGITAELELAVARAGFEEATQSVLAEGATDDRIEWTRHLALLTGLDTAADRAGNPVDQRTLHSSVRRFFEALARRRPLCWMVEDIHWADEALLDLIDLIAGRAKEVPLLILTQARPALLEKRPNWGAGVRGFTSLVLGTLKPKDGQELVRELCRQRGLPESVVDHVGRGAGGNPLFAEELVAVLAERGGEAGVPSAIKALIAARLDALAPAERHALQLAAVFGKVFWLGGLRALDDVPGLAEHLERLESKDLLRSQPRSQFRNEPEFAFKHDLIRDVAYEMLPRSQRRRLHGRIVDWIVQAAGSAGDNYLDQLAYHSLSAGQEERAVGFLTEAAERARQLAVHRQEASLLAQAIEICERLGQLELAGELRARRGTAFERVCMWSQARPELERALELLPLNSQARRSEILLTLAAICYWLMDLPATSRCFSDAAVLAEYSGRPDLIAEAKGWLAGSKCADGDLSAAVEVFRQAVGSMGTRIASLAVYPMALYWLGRNGEASEVASDLVRRLRGLADTSSTMFAYPHLGLALAATGRYDQAMRVFEEAKRFGQEYQVLPFLGRTISMSAGFHLDLFDYSGNEALNEEARELAGTNNFPPTVVSARIDLLLNYARRQAVGLAEALLPDTERAVSANTSWHRWLWDIRLMEARAEIALARSDWSECIGYAHDAIAQSQAKGRVKYELLGLWTRARALDRLGRRFEAIVDLKAGLEKARPLGDPAMVLRLVAALLAVDGNEGLATEAAETVRQMLAVLPDPALRRSFEEAEPVRLVRRLAPAAVANS
jgi:class 3 adenylate cyclase/tetratricopeptide (TPR) repeat protein